MIAKPPNCAIVPSQMNGTRRQPEHRSMIVRAKADQRAQRREQQRQREHDRDDPRRHRELDDHHAVERADQQDRRHADGDLKQRQPQRAATCGSSAVAASANGSMPGPKRISPLTMAALARLISAAPPRPERYRSRCRCAGRAQSANRAMRGGRGHAAQDLRREIGAIAGDAVASSGRTDPAACMTMSAGVRGAMVKSRRAPACAGRACRHRSARYPPPRNE